MGDEDVHVFGPADSLTGGARLGVEGVAGVRRKSSIFSDVGKKLKRLFTNEPRGPRIHRVTNRLYCCRFDTTVNLTVAELGHRLETTHRSHFMVFNLTSEKYNYSLLNDQVLDFKCPPEPFPITLKLLLEICNALHSWLLADTENVAILHCATGRYRVGMVIACYMVYGQAMDNVMEAFETFRRIRGIRRSEVRRFPSIRRYIQHFNDLCLMGQLPNVAPLVLHTVVMNNLPIEADKVAGEFGNELRPCLQIFKETRLVYSSCWRGDGNSTDLPPDGGQGDGVYPMVVFVPESVLHGDIIIKCHYLSMANPTPQTDDMYENISISGSAHPSFRLFFHTAFMPAGVVRLKKSALDGACLDSRFSNDFFIDLMFGTIQSEEEVVPGANLVDGTPVHPNLNNDDLTTFLSPMGSSGPRRKGRRSRQVSESPEADDDSMSNASSLASSASKMARERKKKAKKGVMEHVRKARGSTADVDEIQVNHMKHMMDELKHRSSHNIEDWVQDNYSDVDSEDDDDVGEMVEGNGTVGLSGEINPHQFVPPKCAAKHRSTSFTDVASPYSAATSSPEKGRAAKSKRFDEEAEKLIMQQLEMDSERAPDIQTYRAQVKVESAFPVPAKSAPKGIGAESESPMKELGDAEPLTLPPSSVTAQSLSPKLGSVGAPPPAPPPSGMPAPPPPPSLAGSSAATPKLRQFHWNKVNTHGKQGTVWSDKVGSRSSLAVDMDELHALFARQDLELSKTEAKLREQQNKKIVTLLDVKQANNIAISVNRIKKSNEEIRNAILLCDQSLTVELLSIVLYALPNEDTERKFMGYVQEKKSISNLCEADQFIYAMLPIPRRTVRVQALIYRRNFVTKVSDLRDAMEVVVQACHQVRVSEHLPRILEVVLAVGNTLNSGTYAGQAQAFRLETLLKLSDTRSTTSSSVTLLHYIVSLIERKAPSDLLFFEDFPAVTAAAKLQSNVLLEEYSQLKSGLAEVEAEIKEHARLKHVPKDIAGKDNFQKEMKAFVISAKTHIEVLGTLANRVRSDFAGLVSYFGEDPSCTSEHFFSVLDDFSKAFDNTRKEALQGKHQHAIMSAVNKGKGQGGEAERPSTAP